MKNYVKWMNSCMLSIAMLVVFIAPCTALATPIIYTADLSGPNEDPPVPSTGVGFSKVTIDTNLHTLLVEVTFSDLIWPTTSAHIHSPTAVPGSGNIGVATQTPSFLGFPLGVTSGTYSHMFDMTLVSTFNPSFISNHGLGSVSGAEAALAASLADGTAYINIHTTGFPAGEIRGFYQPVPEPTTILLLGSGLVGLVVFRRKRFSKTSEIS